MSREEWLRRALDVLAKEGQAKLRVRELVDRMGVSTGSFYWHFKNRADFVEQLVNYWAEFSTEQIVERMKSATGSAKSQLLKLMQAINEGDLARYDIPIRAWAAQEPAIARVVKKVDKLRVSVVRQLFVDMGFMGQELEMRVMTFVTFHSLEQGLFERPSKRERKELIKIRHAFFTKR
ncbi:MAG: TetR/AcrR family transcriptional regulator [Arenicellales bacterium]|nr:TetR/AcrR family transcriptional regulator [Arenicellales bacterium]